MNFLAHFYLSHQTPEILIGGFLGDFVKGKRYQDYTPEIRQGILLHREIDRYTDTHPIFLRSKRRLSLRHGHYAGVIVDIFYDHLLAAHWSDYSHQPLSRFAQEVYATLTRHHDTLPLPAQRILAYMRTHDWLTGYASLPGVHQALSGMQRRARFPNRMGAATTELKQDYRLYTREFAQFFPDVQRRVTDFLGPSRIT